LIDKSKTSASTKLKPSFQPLPPSSVLARVKDFLPKIAESNNELLQKNSQDVNMENVEEDAPYIQMNLALGVLEEQSEISEENIIIPNANKLADNHPNIVLLHNEDDGQHEETPDTKIRSKKRSRSNK